MSLLNTNSKQRSRDSPPKDADPSACFASFCKHWQQTYDIILETLPLKSIPSQDDILGVVNHIDQMVTLLLLELRNYNSNRYEQTPTTNHSPCLEHLLNENLLVKLYEWSVHTGRYNNAVRLEQLKLYELLVSHNNALLAHEPVARPLLLLLEECSKDIVPPDVERKLVVLLNQLCVALMQNMALLDLFFYASKTGHSKFIIFTLLMPYIHREGNLGQQARDAMLLCMSLSKKNDKVGLYISDHSHVCVVLATGLSGLYSSMPRKLEIETDDWHRLTTDDVNDIPELAQFMNSLEFCNAAAQVAHPLVQKQLHEFLYQGFLVPVMGPALLQTTVDELVAATAYFDLFLRSVTEPGLLRSFVRFLLENNYDECRILDSLVQRISLKSRVCIVTLALFETLVNLNCEDAMLELCLKTLNPYYHVMRSQRQRLQDIDPFGRGAEKFLSLIPNCCSPFVGSVSPPNSLPNTSRQKHLNTPLDVLRSLPTSIGGYANRLTESLYGNYHAYLCDARQKIVACRMACANWSCQYDGESLKENTTEGSTSTTLVDENSSIESLKYMNLSNDEVDNSSSMDVLASIQTFLLHNESNDRKVAKVDLSTEEQAKLDADIAELLNENVNSSMIHKTDNLIDKKMYDIEIDDSNATMNSLVSVGESSGYESFAFKGSSESTPDNEPFEDILTPCKDFDERDDKFVTKTRDKMPTSTRRNETLNGQPNMGIFLDILFRKLECMMSNNLYVNLHLTGLISRLAVYPQPILQSFLLNHSLVFRPNVGSLLQVLATLKQKIDQFLSKQDDVELLVEQARSFLIDREDKLINARRNLLEAAAQSSSIKRNSSAESFSRGEPKRRSLTSSLKQMFRKSSYSGPSSLTNCLSQPSMVSEDHVEITGDGSGIRYYLKTSWEVPQEITLVQNVVLCAVVLDEWLKELAAITQEHAIVSFTNGFELKS